MTNNIPVICHDDRIVFRVQKHEIGLTNSWYRKFFKEDDPTHYYNSVTEKRYSLDEKDKAFKNGASPVCSRKRRIGKDSYILAKGSYIDFRMNDLYSDMGSRYRTGLDEFVQASTDGIITYSGKADNGTRNHLEAIRNRMKRHAIVASYEHNLLLFDQELITQLFKRLLPFNQDQTRKLGETIYIKGFNSKTALLVKIYDKAKCDYEKGKIKSYTKPILKIEVTFRKDWLESNNFRKVNNFTLQPDIQDKIKKTLKREWKNIFKLAGLTKEFSNIMKTNQKDLFDVVTDHSNTLYQLVNDVEKLKEDNKQIKQNQEKMLKHLGLDPK